MADAPRFSVTIPAYNASATLAETIESVLGQTFADFELVIVDDGSTDETAAIARGYESSDARVTVVSQENRGSGGAYNTAVRTARGDLLVMLSADDLLLPEHLASFDDFIRESPEASIFTCNGYFEYEDGTRVLADPQNRWSQPGGCDLVDMIDACFYGIGAVYRRAVFEAVGGFREDIYAEDYPFWLHALALKFVHRHLDRPLSVHRRNSVQKSSDAIRVRLADIAAIEGVLQTGLLDERETRAAQTVIGRHRKSVAVRRAMSRVLGRDLSEKLIARTRAARLARRSRDSLGR